MLKTLPHKYREALELSELKQMSQLQLAEKLNMSYSGAKTRVQRARQLLKEKMQKEYHIRFDVYGNALECGSRLPCGCD
jgi:RNA polymerase sigma-70 factor (ECF subfamily)